MKNQLAFTLSFVLMALPNLSAFGKNDKFTSLNINSYGSINSCVQTLPILILDRSDLSACKESETLKLKQAYFNFKNLSHNPYAVRYWAGSYARDVLRQTQYKHIYYDTCRGEVITETMSPISRSHQRIEFAVENPNLNSEISAPYLLAPMTDVEAELALAKAKQRCTDFRMFH